jgi:hypothetical protein
MLAELTCQGPDAPPPTPCCLIAPPMQRGSWSPRDRETNPGAPCISQARVHPRPGHAQDWVYPDPGYTWVPGAPGPRVDPDPCYAKQVVLDHVALSLATVAKLNFIMRRYYDTRSNIGSKCKAPCRPHRMAAKGRHKGGGRCEKVLSMLTCRYARAWCSRSDCIVEQYMCNHHAGITVECLRTLLPMRLKLKHRTRPLPRRTHPPRPLSHPGTAGTHSPNRSFSTQPR